MIGSDTTGLVNFTINFKDFYNNTGDTVSTVTDASQVIFDRTNPQVTNITSGQYFSGDVTPIIVETYYS